MSTVVRHGIRFTTSSLQRINSIMLDWRKVIEEKTTRMAAEWFARKSIKVFDKNTLIAAGLGRGEHIANPMSHVSQEWDAKRENLKKGYREPEVDFDFNVVIIPLGRRVIGKIITEQGAWVTQFMERYAEHVREYDYWDTDDPDPDVTAREWAQRRRDWNLFEIDRFGRLSHCGFIAECTAFGSWRPKPSMVFDHVPTFSHRVTSQTRLIAQDRRFALYPHKYRYGSGSMGMVLEAHDWLGTPDGVKLLAEVEAEVREVLKPEVTLEDLLGFKPGPGQQ